MDFETRAIHDGQEPDPATGSITVPIDSRPVSGPRYRPRAGTVTVQQSVTRSHESTHVEPLSSVNTLDVEQFWQYQNEPRRLSSESRRGYGSRAVSSRSSMPAG